MADCSARDANRHAAAAPPTSVMNSRRFISSMGDFLPYAVSAADRPVQSVFRHISLP